MKIYLGDMVHNWEKVSVWCVPLNIGLVASYVQKLFPTEIEIKLFKYPEEIIQAIKTDPPDIVALSYYAWNSNLNNLIFGRVKKVNPHILTVGGGPTITNLNANEEGGRLFFEQQPYCDSYVINQGERGFGKIVGRFIEVQGEPYRFKGEPLDGCLINDIVKSDRVLVGQPLEPLCSLDEIESPYLNGMMDPFLDQSLVPLLETNRNCPYECAYCAFGSTSKKLQLFSLDRVFSEIEYIAKRTTADYMITTDTNFGILKRDADIAEKIHENHIKFGFPGYLCVVWNKTNPKRVLETAKKFKGLAMVGASMQSLNPDVLSVIKRRNLPLDDVVNMKNELHGMETKLFSELISGLPEQNLQSHLDDNRKLMNIDAEVFNYVLRFLPGTKIDSKEFRSRYYRATGWRLQDDAFGLYDGELVFEGEELALETTTMSREEFHFLRFIHFLIQFMWGKRALLDFLKFFQKLGVHPLDFVSKTTEAFINWENSGIIGQTYRQFEADYKLEHFETYGDMCEYWSQPESFERLRSGNHGKLNSFYILRLLMHYDEFLSFIKRIAHDTIDDTLFLELELIKAQCNELLRFSKELLIDSLLNGNDILNSKVRTFSFDIVGWRTNGYDMDILDNRRHSNFEFEFYLTKRQENGLKKQRTFFECGGRRRVLRKMFDANPYDFFYNVKKC